MIRQASTKVRNHASSRHSSRKRPFEPAVLILRLAQASELADPQPAVPGLPVVERLVADPVTSTEVGCLRPGLRLLQDGDDLLLGEPLPRMVVLPVGIVAGPGLPTGMARFSGGQVRVGSPTRWAVAVAPGKPGPMGRSGYPPDLSTYPPSFTALRFSAAGARMSDPKAAAPQQIEKRELIPPFPPSPP
jgi:hypothetical protein